MTDLHELTRRIARLEAAHDISNLMGRIEFLHSAYRNDLIPQYFAARDDLVVEMPFGTYLGRDAAVRAWRGAMQEGVPPQDLTGEYVEHLLTTPVIEVSPDASSARGSWISPGAEAHRLLWEDGAPLHGFWYWGRYDAEFVREEDGWKILRLTVSTTFISDYAHSYTSEEGRLSDPPLPSGPHAPDEPPRAQVTYSPSWDPRALRLAPEPYDSAPALD